MSKIVLGSKEERVAAVPVTLGELLDPKEVISSISVANASLIVPTAIPSSHYGTHQSAPHFPDLGKMRVGGMHPCFAHEVPKVGMGDKPAEGVEDDGRSMLSRSLRLDQLAEIIELRSVAMTPRTCPRRGALRVIIGVPTLNEA